MKVNGSFDESVLQCPPCRNNLGSQVQIAARYSVYWFYINFSKHVHAVTRSEGTEGEQRCSSTIHNVGAIRGAWSTKRSGPFTVPLPLRERPCTYFTGGWIDPRDIRVGCEKSLPPRGSNRGPSTPYRVAILTGLPRYPGCHFVQLFGINIFLELFNFATCVWTSCDVDVALKAVVFNLGYAYPRG